jgi:hypothetical protein
VALIPFFFPKFFIFGVTQLHESRSTDDTFCFFFKSVEANTPLASGRFRCHFHFEHVKHIFTTMLQNEIWVRLFLLWFLAAGIKVAQFLLLIVT